MCWAWDGRLMGLLWGLRHGARREMTQALEGGACLCIGVCSAVSLERLCLSVRRQDGGHQCHTGVQPVSCKGTRAAGISS